MPIFNIISYDELVHYFTNSRIYTINMILSPLSSNFGSKLLFPVMHIDGCFYPAEYFSNALKRPNGNHFTELTIMGAQAYERDVQVKPSHEWWNMG